MPKKMVVDELVERARRETGLDQFDSESYREGLEILVGDANKVEDRTEAGYQAFDGGIVNYLKTRLKVADYIRKNPEVLDTPIRRPVVVLGMPRTGTTLASNLLATDLRRRSLLTWEADDPIPPPKGDELFTDQRVLDRLEIERRMVAENPSAGRFYRSSTVYPTECTFIQGHDFKSLFWESHGRLPAYAEWIMQCDMTSAYDYHRRFLQVLQSKAPGVWNLKMPSHSLHIEAMLKAYPDARLIWTHRDPFTVMGSLCSLIGNAHLGFVGYTDHQWIGRNYPAQIAAHADRLMASRDRIGEDRVFDLHYADMINDPIETFRRLYAWLGDDFTPEVEAGMQAWLDVNPQGKFGKHEYRLEEYDLSEQSLMPHFEGYLARHSVAREG